MGNKQTDAEMMTLTQQFLGLPYRDRINLCNQLRDSILLERSEKRHAEKTRADILLGYIGEVIGEPVPVNCRVAKYVWARAMVAYQLSKEGFSTIESGLMMGKNHATIIHLRNKMQDAFDYPHAYMDIIELWQKFQNKLKYETIRGTTTDIICLGGALPDCGQC